MRKASDILKVIFDGDQIRLAERYASLFDGWRKLVGDDIAAHSRVKDIDGRVLIVETDHPGWLQMIRLKEKKVLTALRKKYPELDIQTIKIYVAQRDDRNDAPHDMHHGRRRREDTQVDSAPAGANRPPDKDREAPSEPDAKENSEDRREFEKTLERLRRLGKTDES